MSRDRPDKKTRAILAASDMPKSMTQYHFTIKHFAKDVKYYVHGFLEKNRDDLPSQLRRLVESSGIPFLKNLYPPLKVLCVQCAASCFVFQRFLPHICQLRMHIATVGQSKKQRRQDHREKVPGRFAALEGSSLVYEPALRAMHQAE